ncbi:MDR family MFS transporter [Chloroflexota bacterium]
MSETSAEPKLNNYSRLPRKQVILTMAGIMLALFLASLDQTIVGTALPRIIADLGGFSQYTWVLTSYLVATTVTVLIAGKLSDLYGRKWVLMSAIVIFITGSILCGLSANMNQLIIFRGFQGIGAGAIMGLTFIIIGDLFPPSERGKYAGFLSGVFGISSVIGPILGGFITDNISWHWIFFINVPLGVLIVILFIFFFPHLRPYIKKPRVDYLGITTMALTVVPLMLALSLGGVDYEWSSPLIIGMLVFSSIMALVFIWVESRVPEPILPLWLFKNNIVSISSAIVFILGFGMFSAIVFVPLYFQGVLGTTATASGTFLIPMMLGVVFGALISGQLLSRAGGHYRLQGAIGIAIMLTGMFLLSKMTAETSDATAIRNIVITGLGLGITMPLFLIAVQNAVPHSVLGIATSTNTFFRTVGGTLGLAIVGSIMNNTFLTSFNEKLSPQISAVIPKEQLAALTENPQALVNPDALAQLQAIFQGMGDQGEVLFNSLLNTLREALSSAIGQVFFVSFFIVLVALVLTVFIRQIPLRKHDRETNHGGEISV